MPSAHFAAAFGAHWRSDIALEAFDQSPSHSEDDGDIRVHRVAVLANRSALRDINRGHVYADGVRMAWREAAFDMYDGARIEYTPLARWRAGMPDSFYSTVAALTLAWRGFVPFHASAVELDGYAILIAGPTGMGKSSLAADLLELGARFVADDLTIARVAQGDGAIEVFRGRPAMRQHKDSASRIDADPPVPSAGDPRGKWLVRPRKRAPEMALPLGGIIVLTPTGLIDGSNGKLAVLAAQLFRPRWLAALPNHAERRRQLLTLAAAVPVVSFPAVSTANASSRGDWASRALAPIEAMIASQNSNAAGSRRLLPLAP